MRLIDAEEAKKFLKEHLILPEKSYEEIAITMLDAVPTAYEVDKVVEQLEKETELAYKRYNDCNSFTPAVVYTRYAAQYQERRKCLETVKSGYRDSGNEMMKETEQMGRLTWEKPNGDWGLNGHSIKEVPRNLYGFFCKLHEYEKNGLEPNEVMDLKNQQKSGGWIPCSERMPKPEEEVLILTKNNTVTTAMHEDGTIYESDSSWFWYDCDFEYDRDEEEYIIPEGWWEYKHFNYDNENNHAVDEEVVAWMPLPKSYKS